MRRPTSRLWPAARITPCPACHRWTGVQASAGLVDFVSEQLLPAPFDDVLRADVERIDGVEAPICSFADLVAMKRATSRGTDLLDLERLAEAHGGLPDDDGPRR